VSTLLSLEDCHVRFGAVRALRGVTLQVQPGEVVGVVGPLGAGKTTLLRLIVGLGHPDAGTVWFDGEDLAGIAWDERARRGVIHVPADGGLFPSLTVRENLMLAEPAAADGALRSRLLELFPVLAERLEQHAGSLSGGEQRQLAIARGALAAPRLLLLDEPLLGLAPRAAQAVLDLLQELRGGGVATVVVEERLTPDVEAIVDRLVGLRDGRIVPASDIRERGSARSVASGELDRVEVEMIGLPLSTRDRRALQTIATSTGRPVGEVIAALVREHVEAQHEVWQ